MKKIILLAAAVLGVLALAGCGKKEEPIDEYALRYSQAGEIIDTGAIKAVCPNGWNAADAYDFRVSTEKPADYILEFVKGGTSAAENRPYLRIVKHEPETEWERPDRSAYDEPADVSAFTAGSHTWSGFSASVDGQRFAWIFTSTENGDLEAWLWMHTGEEVQASVADADVCLALESIVLPEVKKKR